MVADALSRKSSMTLAHFRTAYVPLLFNMKTMGISLDYDGCGALIASFVVRPALVWLLTKPYTRENVEPSYVGMKLVSKI